MNLNDAINVIESAQGFADETTPVGEAWAIVLASLSLTPVPVAERLPGAEDCALWPGEPNAGRWCWMASCVDNGWAWEQRTLGFLASFPQDFTHWLPAHALPLPSGEVE